MSQTLNSRFYYPLVVQRGSVDYSIEAPFVQDLSDPFNTSCVILSVDKGEAQQGLYLNVGHQWQYCLSMVQVSVGIIIGYDIKVYCNLPAPITVGSGTTVFRNGAQIDSHMLLPGTDVYTVMTPITSGLGSVASVNGQLPDARGNVQLDNNFELSVSLPFVPNPDDTVFYQQMPACEFTNATAICDAVNTVPMAFRVMLDGNQVGTITYTGGIGAVSTSLSGVNQHQIMSIIAPPTFDSIVKKFAFVFTFKRN